MKLSNCVHYCIHRFHSNIPPNKHHFHGSPSHNPKSFLFLILVHIFGWRFSTFRPKWTLLVLVGLICSKMFLIIVRKVNFHLSLRCLLVKLTGSNSILTHAINRFHGSVIKVIISTAVVITFVIITGTLVTLDCVTWESRRKMESYNYLQHIT